MDFKHKMTFADWMKQATPDQKEAVFTKVMEDVEQDQIKIARQASDGQAAQAENAPEPKAPGAAATAEDKDKSSPRE